MSHGLSDVSLSRISGVLFPVDLVAVVVSTLAVYALANVAVAPGSPARVLVGLPLLFVLPGYALVAALFPARPSRTDTSHVDGERIADAAIAGRLGRLHQRGVDGVERAVLSVGLSAVILPFVGLALSLIPNGLSTPTVLSSLTGFVLVTAVLAAVRRARLPADQRFSVPLRAAVRTATVDAVGATRSETAVNVALAVSVVAAAAALGVAVAAPPSGGGYTDFHLLTEAESGELVAANYPDSLGSDTAPLVVGVENEEGTTQRYTVVVQLQRVADDGTVTERTRLTTFEPTVESGERWTTRHRPTAEMSGNELRLTYLLYEGDAPANPTRENAYREIYVWVNA